MASQAASLTAAQLKNLPRAETITVLYKEKDATDGDNLRIVGDKFPKSIATAFSTKWKAELVPSNKTNSGEIHSVIVDSIVVTGGSYGIWRDILNWMLGSCQGFGFAQTPSQRFKPYSFQFFVRECAVSIGCDTLQERATKRMERICAEQVHSEDVRALWLVNPPNEETRAFLVEHIAVRLWEKRLKAKSAYWTLREEFPDLNERIDTFLAQLKKDSAGDSRGDRRGRSDVQGVKDTTKKDGVRKVRAQRPQGHGEDGGEGKTVVLKMEVVRKATKKTPAYAKLDLASIGVTREQFCGSRE
ncbi:hypothetical protein Z517_09529 [Fonsecaea pedrosoi CBS 271.37]|uniref:Uncharacterized protein n=1 Tax=Fonsecaea pedrosoi CBS 271.37 TaxID=1442368 RepID=A0A0D2G8S5_9EURO|nr:uncharacterized protein Z517_09529 [Fonsecaea pedrosoi CBS 271.37]KIW77083.1 hypothetical protein Z517_09529 [Fonsecaea pedrosoi CBS 271.37]